MSFVLDGDLLLLDNRMLRLRKVKGYADEGVVLDVEIVIRTGWVIMLLMGLLILAARGLIMPSLMQGVTCLESAVGGTSLF